MYAHTVSQSIARVENERQFIGMRDEISVYAN